LKKSGTRLYVLKSPSSHEWPVKLFAVLQFWGRHKHLTITFHAWLWRPCDYKRPVFPELKVSLGLHCHRFPCCQELPNDKSRINFLLQFTLQGTENVPVSTIDLLSSFYLGNSLSLIAVDLLFCQLVSSSAPAYRNLDATILNGLSTNIMLRAA